MCVRFITDSPVIKVRYELLLDRLAMPHMPATGVSGLDLYAQDAQGIDRWVEVVRPDSKVIEADIAKDLDPGLQELLGYTMGNYALGYFSDPLSIDNKTDILAPEFALGRSPSGNEKFLG